MNKRTIKKKEMPKPLQQIMFFGFKFGFCDGVMPDFAVGGSEDKTVLH